MSCSCSQKNIIALSDIGMVPFTLNLAVHCDHMISNYCELETIYKSLTQINFKNHCVQIYGNIMYACHWATCCSVMLYLYFLAPGVWWFYSSFKILTKQVPISHLGDIHWFLLLSQVKWTLGQFTPAQWDKDEWHPLLGPLRFIQVLSLCIAILTVELNTFFLKFCLWIPPRNPLIVYRLVLWWLIAIPTILLISSEVV